MDVNKPIESKDRSSSLCNVNIFCIVHCSHRVWSPYPSTSKAMYLRNYSERADIPIKFLKQVILEYKTLLRYSFLLLTV